MIDKSKIERLVGKVQASNVVMLDCINELEQELAASRIVIDDGYMEPYWAGICRSEAGHLRFMNSHISMIISLTLKYLKNPSETTIKK